MIRREFADVDFSSVWGLEDDGDFVTAMDELLLEKCAYCEDMQALSAQERIFFIVAHLQAEVYNGGFDQFFYNSTGSFSGEIADACVQIEARKTAGICRKALDAIGRALPANLEMRRELLEETESDERTDLLDACDAEFYECSENLDELLRAYAGKNRSAFG